MERRVTAAASEAAPDGVDAAAPTVVATPDVTAADGVDAAAPTVVATPDVVAAAATLAAGSAERARDEDARIGTTIGRYVVESRLGAGGMGVVYAARDPALDRRVAIKLLPAASAQRPDLETRLHREAQALARLDHPNVVVVHDVGVTADGVFVAMQLVDGSTVDALLEAGELTSRRIVDMFLSAGRGLAAAHDAGLVHRDVKPSNLLVDRDGRVRVGDFGLARDATERDEASSASSTVLAAGVTRDGSVLGTPMFMSPEQHRGERATAKSDQFSFCVSLWHALHRELPFVAVWDRAAAREAMERDAVREPVARIPRRVTRALRRGLRHDPEARWPDMHALLRELAPRTRPYVYAGGAVLVAGAAAAAWFARAGDAAPSCDVSAAVADEVWSPARAASLRAQFAAATPRGADAAERVVPRIDAHVAAWKRERAANCEATRRGDETAELLDLRAICLERSLGEVAARVDAFVRAEAATVDKAASAVAQLTPISACRDTAALRAPVPPPADPVSRAQLAEAWRRLEDLRVETTLGKLQPVLVRVPDIVATGRRLAQPPLEAAALLLQGQIELNLDKLDGARERLREAVRVASLGRDDATAAKATLRLALLAIDKENDAAVGDTHLRSAEAWIARAGNPPALRAKHADYSALLHGNASRPKDAIAAYRRALAFYAAAPEQDDISIADTRINLGGALFDDGQADQALAEVSAAIGAYEKSVGRRHVSVGQALALLGEIQAANKDPRAEATYLEALAILVDTVGEGQLTSQVTGRLATMYLRAHRLADAEVFARRSIAAKEKFGGPDHHFLVNPLETLALVLFERGDPAGAVAATERAVAIARKTTAVSDQVAAILVVHAIVLLAANRIDDAAAASEEAIPKIAKDAGWLVHPCRYVFGRVAIARGRAAEGRRMVDDARAALVALDTPEALDLLRYLDRARP